MPTGPSRHGPLPLLAAKQAVPPGRPTAVARPRLHAPLLANASTRLSVVIAPAGCGKTTLLSQWANDSQERRPIAWVSLDERDDEPVRFWAYVFSAAHAVTPEVGAEALAVMTAPGSDVLDAALATLPERARGERGATCPDPRRLPRAHRRPDPRERGVLPRLRGSCAAPRGCRSIRSAAPPRAAPRRGELTEIRADDLRFGADEARLLFDAIGGFTPDARDPPTSSIGPKAG